jgi:predicted enzyme related to lactoylglutathione lyase
MSKKHFGEFCWNELATNNVQSAKNFYGKIFGWEFTDHVMGEMTYTMIKSGEKEFGGIWQIPTDKANEIPPHWMGYILVENIKDTVAKAEKLGATIKMPITPAGDFGLFTVIADPTGAHIAFWESLHDK